MGILKLHNPSFEMYCKMFLYRRLSQKRKSYVTEKENFPFISWLLTNFYAPWADDGELRLESVSVRAMHCAQC